MFGSWRSSSPSHPSPPRVKSPCTNVCVIDPISGYCEGCLRTAAEIGAWRQLDHSEKLELLAELKNRQLPATGPETGLYRS